MKVGLLTGGGDCPGLNAVIRAVTKCAIKQYGYEVIGICDGYEGLLGNISTTPLTYDSVAGLLFRGGTILGTSNKGDPTAFKSIVNGKVIVKDCTEEFAANCRKLGLNALITVGGDGTQTVAWKLSRKIPDITFIGIPKTIDNDLASTDQTFGFDTALLVATEAVDRIQTTAESHHRVMIVETMGRYAGWIALSAGLAGGADIILIPEIPFTIKGIVAAILYRQNVQKRRFTIIVVAEGAKEAGGDLVVSKTVPDSPDPIRLGGIGEYLAQKISDELPYHEIRVTVLGHVQRGGTPTSFDRILATRFGTEAVHAYARGERSIMVSLRGNEIITVPLSEVGGKTRYVDPNGPLVRTARDTGVNFGNLE